MTADTWVIAKLGDPDPRPPVSRIEAKRDGRFMVEEESNWRFRLDRLGEQLHPDLQEAGTNG